MRLLAAEVVADDRYDDHTRARTKLVSVVRLTQKRPIDESGGRLNIKFHNMVSG